MAKTDVDVAGEPDVLAVRGVPKRACVLAGVLGLLLLGLLVLWAVTAPTPFEDTSPGGGITVPGDAPVHFAASYGPFPDVVVTDARPILGDDSAPAATEVSLCHRRGFGSSLGLLSDECDSVTSLVGQDLGEIDGDVVTLVLTVAPLAGGTVDVEHIEFAFDDGWRSGVQRIPAGMTVTVEPASSAPASAD